MPTPKFQVSNAIAVQPSDNANVPYPEPKQTGSSTSAVASQLVDTTATFLTNGIQPGDIVYNTTDGTAATVTAIVSETVLKLNANIFGSSGKSYVVYSGTNNDGCVLYIGVTGTMKVTVAAGNIVTFVAVPVGFFPVQVIKVFASGTTASSIVALF